MSRAFSVCLGANVWGLGARGTVQNQSSHCPALWGSLGLSWKGPGAPRGVAGRAGPEVLAGNRGEQNRWVRGFRDPQAQPTGQLCSLGDVSQSTGAPYSAASCQDVGSRSLMAESSTGWSELVLWGTLAGDPRLRNRPPTHSWALPHTPTRSLPGYVPVTL